MNCPINNCPINLESPALPPSFGLLLRSVNEAALFRYLLKPVSMPELLKVVQDAAKAHDASVAAAK